jgi:hypothetical protein
VHPFQDCFKVAKVEDGLEMCMRLLWSLLKRRDIWHRLLLERLTEPVHLNLLSLCVAVFGTTRAKVLFDTLVRQQHAYGILAAADAARARGLDAVTVVELGVGSGVGLLNLCELSLRISRLAGVRIEVVGFDTGYGLPPPRDCRDHPELYQEGWFPMQKEDVLARLPQTARLILGDMADTVPRFVASLDPAAPLGFACLDVDYYSSAKNALRLFLGDANCYLPVTPVYVDDIAHRSHNPACGELLAIREWNEEYPYRTIAFDVFLRHRRVFKDAEWLDHMYNLHVLDHPERNRLTTEQLVYAVENPYLS